MLISLPNIILTLELDAYRSIAKCPGGNLYALTPITGNTEKHVGWAKRV